MLRDARRRERSSKRSPACRSAPTDCGRRSRAAVSARPGAVGGVFDGGWAVDCRGRDDDVAAADGRRWEVAAATRGPITVATPTTVRPSRAIGASARRSAARPAPTSRCGCRRRDQHDARAARLRDRRPARPIPLTLEELRRAGPLGGSGAPTPTPCARRHDVSLRMVVARAREGQPRPSSTRHARRRVPRAPHRVSGHRAARYARVRRAAGALHAEVPRRPGVPLDDANLVWKAAAALWTALGRAGDPRDAVITSTRRSRSKRGWAAAARMPPPRCSALGRLWGGAPITLLREVGATIGADVPFFLSGGTALGLGRGEEIYPLVDLPPHFVVIVRPPFGVSTAEAYAWYDEDRASASATRTAEFQQLPVPWPSRAAQMVNDLEPPVMPAAPGNRRGQGPAPGAGATAAAMSGSGSAVFGLFRSRLAAQRATNPCPETAPAPWSPAP